MLPIVLSTDETVKYVSIYDSAIDKTKMSNEDLKAYQADLDLKRLKLIEGVEPTYFELRGLTRYELSCDYVPTANKLTIAYDMVRRGLVSVSGFKFQRRLDKGMLCIPFDTLVKCNLPFEVIAELVNAINTLSEVSETLKNS